MVNMNSYNSVKIKEDNTPSCVKKSKEKGRLNDNLCKKGGIIENFDDIMDTLSVANFLHTAGLHSIVRNDKKLKGKTKDITKGLQKEDVKWLESKYPKEYKRANELGFINDNGLTKDATTVFVSHK